MLRNENFYFCNIIHYNDFLILRMYDLGNEFTAFQNNNFVCTKPGLFILIQKLENKLTN